MDRYYTLMLIPEKNKKIISLKIPIIVVRSIVLLLAVLAIIVVVLIYDYKQIVNEVYENKHLTLENQKLRDQLNIFQMKLNTLSSDIERIHTFEKKLRVITGVEDSIYYNSTLKEDEAEPLNENALDGPLQTRINKKPKEEVLSKPLDEKEFALNLDFKNLDPSEDYDYNQLKNLYYQQLVDSFGVPNNYIYTRAWSKLTTQSINLSNDFALFDYKYGKLKEITSNLEDSIHDLDIFLLDQDSYLKSTPTILPTSGWITSYYGVRKNPVSGRYKIHEGLDIGGRIGTPIVAPADGIVIYSGNKPGFGRFLHIDHGHGIETIYGHNNSLHAKYGEKIKRGNLIATVGNTGLSTGPHLHYEVRVNGVPVDPLYFILD